MKKDQLVLYMSVLGFMMAISLFMMAIGALVSALGLLAAGMVLFSLVLWLPLAWFTAAVAKRLDVLAETGNDLELFKENGRKAEAAKEKA
jgi:divalent metal cation (Fe/Co/Zn/Cd) transporter